MLTPPDIYIIAYEDKGCQVFGFVLEEFDFEKIGGKWASPYPSGIQVIF